MPTLAAQIAPQRNAQYTSLVNALAPHELALSPFGGMIADLAPITMGGQNYLRFSIPEAPDSSLLHEFGCMAMTSAYFLYHDHIGDVAGPLLQPLEIDFVPTLPVELLEARRYRGKTNERFTHFLCNLARYSSGFAKHPWRELRVLDPLAGGGTTLFAALILGADAAGVEQNRKDVETTAGFLRQFLREQRIATREDVERFRNVGQRWSFTMGRTRKGNTPQRCLLAHGDTTDSITLISGFKPHLIVTDLPYGIQHRGGIEQLLTDALPIWTSLLPPGGVLVFSWDAARTPRPAIVDLVNTQSKLHVFNHPPYTQLAHRVDRVIKARDVLVARRD